MDTENTKVEAGLGAILMGGFFMLAVLLFFAAPPIAHYWERWAGYWSSEPATSEHIFTQYDHDKMIWDRGYNFGYQNAISTTTLDIPYCDEINPKESVCQFHSREDAEQQGFLVP